MVELTLDQALQQGVEAHKAGQLQKADRLYTAILKAQPKHPDANHNMGVLAVGVGKVEEALPFFKTALEVNSNIAQYWLSYLDALIKLNRMTDAKAVFDQAKSKGTQGEAFDQLKKRLASSLPTTANTQEPSQQQLNSLFNLYNQNKFQQVFSEAQKLTKRYTKSLPLWNLLGASAAQLGQIDEAVTAFQKAINIKPDYADAYNNMGNALQEQGKLEEAIEAFKKAISIEPVYADSYYNMGNALKEQGKLEEAVEAYKKAISIKPVYAVAYNNMGIALQGQGKLQEAIEAYTKAISIKPDYSEAYSNTVEFLKTYTPERETYHNLINIDSKIKKLSPRILHATSNNEIIDNLELGLSYISEEGFEYRTPLSQIYKRNTVDLNCKRHMKIFDTKDIIPEFCFGCFKVQVEVATVIDLVKITSLFYKFNFEEDLTRKTMIELRPNISGYYKGLIYCRGLEQAKKVKSSLDIYLIAIFGENTTSQIKRGCSEYPIKFPEYGEIAEKHNDMMSFPKDWELIEKKFDQNELILPIENRQASLSNFCLADFYIIQKWIDYAKGVGDQSIEAFNDRPIIFTDIYEKAKIRAIS